MRTSLWEQKKDNRKDGNDNSFAWEDDDWADIIQLYKNQMMAQTLSTLPLSPSKSARWWYGLCRVSVGSSLKPASPHLARLNQLTRMGRKTENEKSAQVSEVWSIWYSQCLLIQNWMVQYASTLCLILCSMHSIVANLDPSKTSLPNKNNTRGHLFLTVGVLIFPNQSEHYPNKKKK